MSAAKSPGPKVVTHASSTFAASARRRPTCLARLAAGAIIGRARPGFDKPRRIVYGSRMHRIRKRSGGWRSVCLTLAVLALARKVLVPQGFMVAVRGAPFPLVICTGHGPLTVTLDQHGDPKAPAHKTSDAPCAFAGNLTPTAPSDVAVLAEPYAMVADRLHGDHGVDLAPGRGLAAPPPPSHAPPVLSV